jgi:hypothetical protein
MSSTTPAVVVGVVGVVVVGVRGNRVLAAPGLGCGGRLAAGVVETPGVTGTAGGDSATIRWRW